MILRGRCVNPGKAEGEVIVAREPLSFLGDFDPSTGRIIPATHSLFGQAIKDKILVYPTGRGSTTAPGIAYLARRAGTLPRAIIVWEIEPVLAAAILVTDIPAVDRLDRDPLEAIETGDFLIVDAGEGTVQVFRQ